MMELRSRGVISKHARLPRRRSENFGGRALTDSLLAHRGDVALGVDLDLGALPGTVKVSLDGHVCGSVVKVLCSGSVEKIGRGLEGRKAREWGGMAG